MEIKVENTNRKHKGNQAIKFHGKYVSSAKNIANNFIIQYTAVGRHVCSKLTRLVTRKAKSFSTADSTTSTRTEEVIKYA